MYDVKSVTLKGGESLPLYTLAMTDAISAVPHSVRITWLSEPYFSLYFSQILISLMLKRS